MSDEPKYYDSAGHECSLDELCRREPEWAANRHRVMLARIAELETSVKQLLADTTMKEFAARETERADRNGKRAEKMEVENATLRQKLETLEYKLERAQGRWQP
jgi:hypothetical protein